MGVDLNSAEEIRGFYQKMMNDAYLWADFESVIMG
jgi:hypothetical protein